MEGNTIFWRQRWSVAGQAVSGGSGVAWRGRVLCKEEDSPVGSSAANGSDGGGPHEEVRHS